MWKRNLVSPPEDEISVDYSLFAPKGTLTNWTFAIFSTGLAWIQCDFLLGVEELLACIHIHIVLKQLLNAHVVVYAVVPEGGGVEYAYMHPDIFI